MDNPLETLTDEELREAARILRERLEELDAKLARR